MRKFIGHKMRFMVDGGKVEGEFLGEGQGDEKGTILVKDANGVTWRVPKGKIGIFTYADPKDEASDFVPFMVLRCVNQATGCPGVKFVKEGAGFKRSDFSLFMDNCPCKEESCRFGSAGELRSVDGELLREMLADTLFGKYPEKKGKSNGHRPASKKVERAEDESSGCGGAEQ